MKISWYLFVCTNTFIMGIFKLTHGIIIQWKCIEDCEIVEPACALTVIGIAHNLPHYGHIVSFVC